MIDSKGFTCYWPGYDGRIWRITNCWLDHYSIHVWSNVAFISRHAVEMSSVAEDMERLFLATHDLGKGNLCK